ncbi:MAG: extracellular solute-binding protein [Bacillales bacterium]|jgi:multiple sugar transport system substrate-binding protein|nr:extracellular solute-binding protein [Bacillales bacterium]
MKKKIMLSLLAAIALTACGGLSGNSDDESAAISSILKADEDGVKKTDVYDGSAVTVEFWHNAGANNQAMFKEFADEFKTLYPNITVNQVVKSGNYNDLEKAVKASIGAGSYPTMAYCYPDHVANYLDSGYVQDLEQLIDSNSPEIALSEESRNDILTGAWEEGQSYKVGIRSFAFSKSTEALFYDINYFTEHNLVMPEQPTWEQIWSLADQIKTIDAAKTAGGRGIPFCYDSSDNLFITASQQLGIPYTNTDGGILFNNAQAKEMVTYFRDQFTAGRFVVAKAISDSAYGSDFSKLIESERNKDYNIRMYVGSTGGARYSQFASGYNAGIRAVPYFGTKLDGSVNNSADAKDQILQGPSITIFQKANKQETIAAWLYVKFMTNSLNSGRYSKLSGYAPIRHESFSLELPLESVNAGQLVGASVAWAFNEDKSDAVPTVTGSTLQLSEWNPTGQDKALADCIKLFDKSGDNMFTSAVFKKSSKTRDAVGALFTQVLKGANINSAFNSAEEDAKF